MFRRVAALFGGRQQDTEIFFDLGLANVFFPRLWPQRTVKILCIVPGDSWWFV
jgi:hypothetical protein